jgi:hypothetical protein
MPAKPELTYAQQFLDVFKGLCQRHGRQKVWGDFILMSACGISNAVDKAHFEQREGMYMQAARSYTADELDKITQLFGFTVLALEENSEQDFLGGLFTVLNLFDARKGQVFTPYPIAKLMALSSCGNLTEQIKEKGVISVNDCCCGSGGLLIAFANAARAQGVNYQRDIVFVAQDIDFTVAMACYIQLALLGCPGYVAVGNSLSPEPPPPEDIWVLPMNTIQKLNRGNH